MSPCSFLLALGVYMSGRTWLWATHRSQMRNKQVKLGGVLTEILICSHPAKNNELVGIAQFCVEKLGAIIAHKITTWSIGQDPITRTPCDVRAENGTDLDVWSALPALHWPTYTVTVSFFLGNLLFNRWNGSGCIYATHTHTSIACPVTRLFFCVVFFSFLRQRRRWIACLTVFLFPFACSFPSCYLLVHRLHSACSIRFYPRSFLPLRNWRFIGVQFSFLLCWALLKKERGTRERERESSQVKSRRYYSPRWSFTLSKRSGVPNNTLSPLN